MKGAKSSLNPYAAAYIPLSRRGVTDEMKGYNLAADSLKSEHDEAFWMGSQPGNATPHQYQKASQSYNVHNTASEDSKLKGHSAYGSYGSSSLYPNDTVEKQTLDDESDMDLAYLQMTFPGVSDESLSDVYLANKGDLEATLDMLNQLELYTVDSTENLPETLDIGDVSESGLSGQKLKNVSGEVGGSSSGSRPLTT